MFEHAISHVRPLTSVTLHLDLLPLNHVRPQHLQDEGNQYLTRLVGFFALQCPRYFLSKGLFVRTKVMVFPFVNQTWYKHTWGGCFWVIEL